MIGEVAPFLVPEFGPLLVSLLAIAGGFVALGLVTVLHGFVRATVGGIGGLLGKLPGVGHVLASPVNAVVHWMDHEFAAAELALDKLIARYLHSLGRLVHWWAQEFGDLSRLLYTVTTVMLGTAAIDALERLVGLVRNEVHAVERTAQAALHRIGRLEHATVATVERWLAPRVHALEHAIDDVIPRDIAGLRARTRAIVDRLDGVWRQVRKMDALLGTAALTAAVAVALPRLGLSWVRCRNWRRIGEGICGLPFALIDALLLGAIDALLLTDLCDLSYLMTLAAEELRPAMLAFVDVEQALVGCHGNTAPPLLSLRQLSLEPAATTLTLAA